MSAGDDRTWTIELCNDCGGLARHGWRPAQRWEPVKESHMLTKTLDDILGDTRNRIWLCSHHHELVTNGRVEAPLPDSVWIFAKEFGLEGMLDNDIARRARV
jgi:hypothetical protein